LSLQQESQIREGFHNHVTDQEGANYSCRGRAQGRQSMSQAAQRGHTPLPQHHQVHVTIEGIQATCTTDLGQTGNWKNKT
jgi:hypothetical protein